MKNNIVLALLLSITLSGAVNAEELKIGNNFDLHYGLAHHYLERADFDLAELELEQALIRNPDSTRAHRDYMITCLTHLNIGQALAELMMTLGLGKPIPLTTVEQTQLNRDTAKAHYRKALRYEIQNRLEREIFELTWANYYLPNNPTIMRSLAFALSNAFKHDEAEVLYRKSFTVAPESDKSTEDAYAHADFAYMLGKMSRQNDAIEELKKAIALDPKSPALHADMAWFLEAKGDLSGATYEVAKAIDLAPNYVVGNIEVPTSSHDFFGLKMMTYHKEQAIYSNAGLWEQLAKLLDKQGKSVEAKKAYERALQLDPQQEDVKKRLSEMQQKQS
jgi:tetratricopeptide (TPR) repeat protein